MPHAVPKFEKKWEEVLQPANNLIARREFLKTWEEVNPWTRENVPGMQEAVAQIEKAH